MKKIAYIHFSDLHIGQKYANQYLSNAKDIVLQDLDFILIVETPGRVPVSRKKELSCKQKCLRLIFL